MKSDSFDGEGYGDHGRPGLPEIPEIGATQDDFFSMEWDDLQEYKVIPVLDDPWTFADTVSYTKRSIIKPIDHPSGQSNTPPFPPFIFWIKGPLLELLLVYENARLIASSYNAAFLATREVGA